MRKNQYEEALFKCEDERFEIDMVIDSNMSTIRVLEPLAEEILSLKQIGGKRDPNGPRYSLQLEKRQLSTIHLNAISRIYGDHGEEILEMLRKNPAGTIPVVLKRLKQKDQEWRKARHELNKHWKEVVEKNHYKSFDHRSFYFRQTDKKYLSTKPLVQEIQTVVNNNGVAPGTGVASINTNTSTRARMMLLSNPDDSHNQGVAYSVPSAYESLLAGMSPHMVLSYPHDHHLVHRDIYRIICHAAESTLSNPSDKERLAALWRDLIRTFFNIPPHYLYSQSSDASLASDTKHATAAGEAWPANTKVVTTYGSGTVLSFREDDDIYEVQLAFGKAFLNSSSIFGAEQLSANALYVSPARSIAFFSLIVSSFFSCSFSLPGDRGLQRPENRKRLDFQWHRRCRQAKCTSRAGSLQALLRNADVLCLPPSAPHSLHEALHRPPAGQGSGAVASGAVAEELGPLHLLVHR
jgi:paired amphipathic helix protein Sin3a